MFLNYQWATATAVIARALASEAEFILLDEPLVEVIANREIHFEILDNLCHLSQKQY